MIFEDLHDERRVVTAANVALVKLEERPLKIQLDVIFFVDNG